VQMSRHYPFSSLLQSENTCAILCWLMVWIPKSANIIELALKSGKYGMGRLCLPNSQDEIFNVASKKKQRGLRGPETHFTFWNSF
jgi:hypothetical protein